MRSTISCECHSKRGKYDQLNNLSIALDQIIDIEKKDRWFIKFRLIDAEPIIWCFVNNTAGRDAEYERVAQIIKENKPAKTLV